MYFLLKTREDYVLCELNKSEGVYIPNIAFGETLAELQNQCDLIFEEGAINVKSLKVVEGDEL